MVNNRRYLYFNGRTDDWTRKDGENFSAESAAEYAAKIPGVALAVAYGAPCAVSDEKVMATVQMRENGDTTYHRLTPEAYADIKAEFEKNGRASLLG
ncbi:MAG: hypothetical protein SWC96_11305 [Thermodesulfobacteriota bacterium]|nr:hypothetical protein [Thermodesulfobacteriota bacterium]